MNNDKSAIQVIAGAARCPEYSPSMVKALMKKLETNEKAFALLMNVTPATVRLWTTGAARPCSMARRLSLIHIWKGFMVLVGVSDSDTKEIADKMIRKMLALRIFEDEQGKTNLSLDTVGGELLLISQFTLYANCKKGNRPSFIEAVAPDMAEAMYEYIIEKCKEQVEVVERGRFGADMKVSLVNDGPFTLILDSDTL